MKFTGLLATVVYDTSSWNIKGYIWTCAVSIQSLYIFIRQLSKICRRTKNSWTRHWAEKPCFCCSYMKIRKAAMLWLLEEGKGKHGVVMILNSSSLILMTGLEELLWDTHALNYIDRVILGIPFLPEKRSLKFLTCLTRIKNDKSFKIFMSLTTVYWTSFTNKSQGSSVGITTGYGLDDRGSGGSIPGEVWEFFSSPSRPDRFWSPPSLLSNGYRELFPQR
jgi:hypothetical protein